MSKAATWLLWCFVFVMPWDEFVELPLLGSIPHLIGIAASAAGVLHILARRTLRPLRWFHGFAGLFVLWAGASVFWSIDPEASESRFLTYLQLGVLVWLIWEIAPSSRQGRALLQAYVLGASVSAVAAEPSRIHGRLGIGARHHHVMGIAAGPTARHFAVGRGGAAPSQRGTLQNEDAAPFAHDEAIATPIEGT